MVTVFDLPLGRQRAKLLALVLEAEGIACRLTRSDQGWVLEVNASDLEAARTSIDAYDAENPVPQEQAEPAPFAFSQAGLRKSCTLIHRRLYKSNLPFTSIPVLQNRVRL